MKLNNIDGHNNFYIFDKKVFRLVASLAKDFNFLLRCQAMSI